MIEGSTAATIDSKGYAVEKGRMAVEDALKRRGVKAKVTSTSRVPYYLVRYEYETEPNGFNHYSNKKIMQILQNNV